MSDTPSDISVSCVIAIVGGGMVGASLALVLARAMPGVSITLIETKALAEDDSETILQPSFDGRSTALAPSSVQVMRELGMWDELAPYATAIEAIHVSDQGHWGLSQFEREDNNGLPLGYVVENAGFGRVLQRALRRKTNIQVLAPAHVTGILPKMQGVTVQLSDRNVLADVVLIADGADSPLRARLGIGVRERAYEQHALVANVSFSQPHGGRAFERFTQDGPLALLPLGRSAQGHQSALVWTFPITDITDAMTASDDELLARLQTAFGYRLGRFTHISKRAAYPLRLVVAQEQVRSGIVIMGNAAHFLHPVAGQGFNLSLRDSLRLAEILATGAGQGQHLGSLALLQTYVRAQAEDQSRTILLSDSFNQVFIRQVDYWRWGRDFGMLLLELAPRLRSRFIVQLAGQASPQARPW